VSCHRSIRRNAHTRTVAADDGPVNRSRYVGAAQELLQELHRIPLLIKIVPCFRLYLFGCITSFITLSYPHTLSNTF
jgi:hypothetical protein